MTVCSVKGVAHSKELTEFSANSIDSLFIIFLFSKTKNPSVLYCIQHQTAGRKNQWVPGGHSRALDLEKTHNIWLLSSLRQGTTGIHSWVKRLCGSHGNLFVPAAMGTWHLGGNTPPFAHFRHSAVTYAGACIVLDPSPFRWWLNIVQVGFERETEVKETKSNHNNFFFLLAPVRLPTVPFCGIFIYQIHILVYILAC